jgi:hypothetical protein
MATEFTDDAPREEEAGKKTEPVPTTKPDGDEVSDARAALVNQWIDRVKDSKKFHAKAFKRMDTCMQLAKDGGNEAWVEADKYTVAIVNRHINLSVAQLYAKDPKVVAKRRRRMMFSVWDGDVETYAAALQTTMMAQAMEQQAMAAGMVDPMTGMPLTPPVDPAQSALVQDVEQGVEYNKMVDKIGKTAEILWSYFAGEQANDFKDQMKQVVRRTKVCGVGYVKLMFQRDLKKSPEITAAINDATEQLASLNAMQLQLEAGKIEPDSARAEELRLLVQQLQAKEYVIAREGPTYDYPRSKEIIIDKNCRHLKSFAGARWIAHEFDKTPDEVLEDYGIDIKGSFKEYNQDTGVAADGRSRSRDKGRSTAKLWEIQDKKNGQCLTVCDGYPDFLKEPGSPYITTERFWTVLPLVFNEIESDREIYPPSDVWLLRHSQDEYNRAREGLREHRKASRPRWVAPKGAFDDPDRTKLESNDPFQLIELKALKIGQKITDIIQALPAAPIDPNLYEVNQAFTDVMRTVGVQEANLGGSSDASATESSIGESSRMATVSDNIDDLDDLLTKIAKDTIQICLLELSQETVVEICGPGAVWPQMQGNREEIAKDLMLEIVAGSSGRPNKAADLANMERGIPYLLQLPGVNPTPIARRYTQLLDMDMDEMIAEGLPSIQAMNARMGHPPQAPTGDAQTDPNQQGGEGADNAQGPQQNENEGGGQPAYPDTQFDEQGNPVAA